MPAETHQCGSHSATPEEVFDLLVLLLGEDAPARPAEARLGDLQLTETHVWDLWASVCEELGERSLGPELDPSLWTPGTTLWSLAVLMASSLTGTEPAAAPPEPAGMATSELTAGPESAEPRCEFF